MEIVLLIVAIVVALFFFGMSRGKKAVRAYVYLAARSEGKSELEANNLASTVDTHHAGQLNAAMLTFAQHCYNGSQLAMISDAKMNGFRE